MRVLTSIVVLLALAVVLVAIFRPHPGVQAQAPAPAVEGVPPVTDPQVAREQSYGRRVEYVASRAPALSYVSFGPKIRTAYYRGVGIENGIVTDKGTMYVTQVYTQPQGTMRQFYVLSNLYAGRTTPVQLPALSRNPSFPGYLALTFDARSRGNIVLVDASDYDGHQFVLSVTGLQSTVIPGLKRADDYFVNGFGNSSRCVQLDDSPSSPYLLWLVEGAGRKVPLLSRAELARATAGVVDTTSKTGIALTCSYFAGQNFINVRDSVASFVMRWSAGHASVVSQGYFDVSGKTHARITKPGADEHGPPGENLELFLVR